MSIDGRGIESAPVIHGGRLLFSCNFRLASTMNDVPCAEPLAQSLLTWVAAVKLSSVPLESVSSRFDDIRLEYLVLALLDMDEREAAQVEMLAGSNAPFNRSPESFYDTLQQAIRELRLFKLFARTRDEEYHKSICLPAYNERTDEHYPEEMARWRADFRAMRPEQQMMTATIIWLYRSGSDSIWLRRVPCTWRASEALHYMHDAGCLALWLQLIARYPGW